MKRGSKFLIAIVAAVLTFGSLMAFVGPQRSGWNHYGHGHHGGWRHHHHYNDDYRRVPADTAENTSYY